MPLICLETLINAPVQIVFDLSRSLDLHKTSMKKYNEEIIGGAKEGLIREGDTVKWRAKHFFKNRTLHIKLTKLVPHDFFEDEMIAGDFKTMRHEHHFHEKEGSTLMLDKFYFETPFGFVGKLVNKLFLKVYMTRLLLERNNEIKRIAESDLWKQYLTHE